MRFFPGRAFAAMLLFGCASVVVRAQDPTNQYEYAKLIKSAELVGTLGPDMFGDHVNFYTGDLSFSATDVSLPGNNALPVSVGRSYSIQDPIYPMKVGAFADWDIDIPHLSATFIKDFGWQVDRPGNREARCTVADVAQAAAPILSILPYSGNVLPDSYWHGFILQQPGGGSQTLLHWGGFDPRAQAASPYFWATNNNWKVSCPGAVANGVGEAFLALAPDGTTYRFDWISKREVIGITVASGNGGYLVAAQSQPSGRSSKAPSGSSAELVGPAPDISATGAVYFGREEVSIYPTLVTDRFGNWVSYTFDPAKPGRVTKIQSNDGRLVTLAYNAAGYVATAFDGTRTWNYGYTNARLTSVTLPDGSQWTYDLHGYQMTYSTSASCAYSGLATGGNMTNTITHPSGAVGTFVVAVINHGRSYVLGKCTEDANSPGGGGGYLRDPINFATTGIVSKQISGPGMASPALWSYSYGPANASWAEDCAAGCPTTKTVSVTGPADFVRYTFGNKSLYNEGKLLTVERGSNAVTILSTETTTYLLDPTNQDYLNNIGTLVPDRTDDTSYKYTPVIQRTLQVQGATFDWKVSSTTGKYSFDTFALPKTVIRSSTGTVGAGGYTKTETTAYYHDMTKWVIGQVASVTDVGTAKVMSQTSYHLTLDLPLTRSRFGVLQQTMGYNSDGTLASVKDGLNHTITLGSWYRGVPRSIGYPTTFAQSAVVNPIGTLASTTDELGYTHNYGYDTMGRLARITYPTVDTAAWNDTTRSFAKTTSAEYVGISVGQWKQVVSTGAGKSSTYFDAQWRPVLELTEDTGNATSKRFVVHRYDPMGREVFVSYPVASLSAAGVGDLNMTGVTTSYDALSRVIQTQQASELGALTTTTEYLTGFQTRVTNPRGTKTTTNYQVFDTPSADAPVKIISGVGTAEQQTTTITRDGYGKPLSVTRSGSGG